MTGSQKLRGGLGDIPQRWRFRNKRRGCLAIWAKSLKPRFIHSFPQVAIQQVIWVPALGIRESKASPGPRPTLSAMGKTDVEPLSEINVGTAEGQVITGDAEVAPWPALGLQPEDATASVVFTEKRQANPTSPIPDCSQLGPPKEVSYPLRGRMERTFQEKRTAHSAKLRTQRPSRGGSGWTDGCVPKQMNQAEPRMGTDQAMWSMALWSHFEDTNALLSPPTASTTTSA